MFEDFSTLHLHGCFLHASCTQGQRFAYAGTFPKLSGQPNVACVLQVGRLKAPDGGGGCWLVLDGAHTGASAAALADTLRRAFPQVNHVAVTRHSCWQSTTSQSPVRSVYEVIATDLAQTFTCCILGVGAAPVGAFAG